MHLNLALRLSRHPSWPVGALGWEQLEKIIRRCTPAKVCVVRGAGLDEFNGVCEKLQQVSDRVNREVNFRIFRGFMLLRLVTLNWNATASRISMNKLIAHAGVHIKDFPPHVFIVK